MGEHTTGNWFLGKVRNFFSFRTNDKLGILIALVILIAVSSIISPSFLSARNLLNILRQNAMLGVVLIGMTVVIIGGGIDLSVGSTLAVCGLVAAYCMDLPFVLIAVIVVATGMVIGLVNGYLIAYQKMESFIVTLSSQISLRGLCLFLTGGMYISNVKSFEWVGRGMAGPVSVPALIMLALFAVFAVVSTKTVFGRNVFAVGGGEVAAKLSGINTQNVKMFTYVISGAMCGIASLINVARLSTAEPLAGTALEVDAIAAALVGGNSLLGGRGSISGAFLGLLVFAVLANIFNLIGLGSSEQQILKGMIIVVAVLISQRRKG